MAHARAHLRIASRVTTTVAGRRPSLAELGRELAILVAERASCGASGGATPQNRTAPTRGRTTRYSNDGAAGVATAVVVSRAW
jgi:hypothetical protein